MNRHVGAIAGRLSLRPPQREALEILDRVADLIPLSKTRDLPAALAAIRGTFPTVEDFERDFPSICFALATGVGKTRLMGAFISYLYLAKGIRHFFVLAPNLTIYDKLIADFTPNTPKYVFQGIAEFASSPPEIITGDNYESRAAASQASFAPIDVNIFNVSKINAEVRGGKAPRIKRLSEYIGESYFDYLSSLDDLVLLMDESHRYRADAGVRVLNELKPILGLELTATPMVEQGAKEPLQFRNVIYSYPLATAIRDGFVKEPAAATRENFDADAYTDAQLELLKLEDGIRVHQMAKAELETYSRNHDLQIVKPFVLVIARDIAHAAALKRLIESDAFFEGRYRGHVIEVHSAQKGEERDENVQRLLAVEHPDEPTEIVIHVNMLKEGWDVTNLYTIVPLRKADSRVLVEQSVGRGLRLPFGRRTGVPAVDRLTIIAHEHFKKIIDEANEPNSIIRQGVVIGRDIPEDRRLSVTVQPLLDTIVLGTGRAIDASGAVPLEPVFATLEEQGLARIALDVVKKLGRLSRSYDLTTPEVRSQIADEVRMLYGGGQADLGLEGASSAAAVDKVVSKVTKLYTELSIDIPKIIVVPRGDSTSGYHDFDLDLRSVHLEPVAHDILIHHLQSNQRDRIAADGAIVPEARPENYIVRALMDFDDVSYDDSADLLYKLAGQVVGHLRGYLKDEGKVENVLQYYSRTLADIVHGQMQDHVWESQAGFDVQVSKGFTVLRPGNFTVPVGEADRSFRAPVEQKALIRGMLFSGFTRCLYPKQRFDSDPERQFAVLLEDERDVLKWCKPVPNQFQIIYRFGREEHPYEPDFVVETLTEKLICEPKRSDETKDPEVLAKAEAAALWCQNATDHARKHGGKPWRYLLIPHHSIEASKTLAALVVQCTYISSTPTKESSL
jgi:type III restriction enzyme